MTVSKTVPKLTRDKKNSQLDYKGLRIVMVTRLSFLYKQVSTLVSHSSAWVIQCLPPIDYGMLHTLKSVQYNMSTLDGLL